MKSAVPNSGDGVRLNRFLGLCGVTARRKADELIAEGRVRVNGEVVSELGTQVDPETDVVTVAGRVVRLPQGFVYLVVNKPRGYLSSVSDDRGRRVVVDLIRIKERVYPVGRLDYDAEGLLLLTNDGELAHRLTHPRFGAERTYEVWLQASIGEQELEALKKGVVLSDGPAKPTRVKVLSDCADGTLLQITLKEGRKREMKRMLERVGHRVRRLRRVSFANLCLGDLPEGEWCFLTEEEVESLKRAVGVGSKESP